MLNRHYCVHDPAFDTLRWVEPQDESVHSVRFEVYFNGALCVNHTEQFSPWDMLGTGQASSPLFHLALSILSAR